MNYYHLTTPQQNIWNLQKYYADTAIANLCGAIFFREKRDSAKLREAIRLFIQSQSGIRLRFRDGETPTQYVEDEVSGEIPVLEFASREEFDRYAEVFAKEPLGLAERALYRFVVFRIGEASGILVVLSHLVADAWTFGLMAKRIDEAYQELAVLPKEQDCRINVLAGGDYLDFVHAESAYFASERYQKDRIFWEKKYDKRPEESPVRLRPVSSSSVAAKRLTKTLPLALEERIAVFCKEHPVTPAVLFETAVFVYLSKLNRENRTVTIGVPVLNRSNAKEKAIAGMFISTMPLTVEVEQDMPVIELESRITKGHMDIFRHQKYPYVDILKSLREKQNFSGNLYDVMVSYQNARTETGADTKWYSNGYSEIPLAVHIDKRDGGESHTINLDYQAGVFCEAEARYFMERLETVLGQLVDNVDQRVREVRIVPDRELHMMIEKFNDTAVEYPREKCVHELFEEQVARSPESIALVAEDRTLTYGELNALANGIAHALVKKGVKLGDIVAFALPRKSGMIAAMLGILKSGAAYMPIDIEYPQERIDYMLADSQARVYITEENYGEFVEETHEENLNLHVDPHSPCYCIYTSGSTGKPKGALISHQNLVNFCDNNEKNTYQHDMITRGCCMVSTTQVCFDIFSFEVMLSLLNGVSVVLTNERQVNGTEDIASLIMENHVDIIQTTPSKMLMFLSGQNFSQALQRLKIIMIGAESFPEFLYKKLREHTNAQIYNGYGPTETTIGVSFKRLCNTDITIGKPIANTQIYILDHDSNPLPIGVAGELCIAGDGVGLGYLNRPELMAERFVPNPFATAENGHGKTMYRTGDLARWRADGELEYLGRIDTQVKIRGLRIELGEIESVMGSFPGIALCAAADKKDENGRQYLVGYYTTLAGEIDEKKLREHLLAKLPRYMVPNYFMRLDSMPMTASGKTDRKNLPVPDFSVQSLYLAPKDERERTLCRIAGELLGVERFGAGDDFFLSGGDSLTAIVFVAHAHDAGIGFALQNVFDHPTVRSLCEWLDEGTAETVHYEAADFEKYREIFAANVIDEDFSPKKRSLGNILLTGATGFLGAHVLDALMREETGKVYCLVRSGSGDDRRGRLREILRYYFGECYEEEFGRRIIPVVGDIEREGLGDVPSDVQTVIHTAASVKHYGAYSYFHRVNCEGTRHVAEYAKKVGAKLIHVSTLSVSGNSMADDFTAYRSEEEKHFYETSFYIGQPLDNVYIHSKFEAERAVYDAVLDGLDAKVIRVGNLTNRLSDYKFQPNYKENAFLTRVKAALEFGLFPDYLMPLYSEFSPVDKTAEGIVRIAQYADGQRVFHLNSNRPIYFDRFLEVVHELGIPMEVVGHERFLAELKSTMKEAGTEYIFEAFQNDMDGEGKLVYDSNIRIENDFTVWFLKRVGFEWNETDLEYIRGYVEYFRRLGYLGVDTLD